MTQVVELIDEPNLLPGWSAWLHVIANGKRYTVYGGPAGERVWRGWRSWPPCAALLRARRYCLTRRNRVWWLR